MGIEENKEIIRKIYGELDKRNFDVIDEYFADDFVRYSVTGISADREGFKRFQIGVSTRYPDIKRTLENIVAEGDQVVFSINWTGTDKVGTDDRPATGKKLIVAECFFSRFKNGKIVEYKQYADRLSMYEQVGVTPKIPK